MRRNYADDYLDGIVIGHLLEAMRQAHHLGRSFRACLLMARKQHNKEVREAADATPLPAK
jgi:hypothetical protein